MVREVESGNVVLEPRYEEHGEVEVGRTIVYTPEGEYLLDVEVTRTGRETRFSMVMDAGVVEKDVFEEALDDSEVGDSILLTDEVPKNSYLGSLENKGYETDDESSMRVKCYRFDDSDWNVNLENPLTGYPASLRIDGFAENVEEVVNAFSDYAERVSDYSLSQSSRYDDDIDFVLGEADLGSWGRDDWEDVIMDAFSEAIEVTPDLKDRTSLED